MSLEDLLNHSELFSLLYYGHSVEANRLLKEELKKLKTSSLQEIRLFLSSLNLGMYQYILIHEKISLHKSCYENEKQIAHCTFQNYTSIGEDILNSYIYCKEYLVEKHKNNHIKNAIAYIHEHLAEPMTLSTVCKAISINNCYLCDLFRKEVGMTFSEYVLNRRITLAKKLLLTTNLTISQISIRCGFQQLSYFCTSFKKVEGVSPSTFQKNNSL